MKWRQWSVFPRTPGEHDRYGVPRIHAYLDQPWWVPLQLVFAIACRPKPGAPSCLLQRKTPLWKR
jgi:hypothetical protein